MSEAEVEEEEGPVDLGVTVDAGGLLNWLDEWTKELVTTPEQSVVQALENSVQQFTIEAVKTFVLRNAALIWKEKYETAFSLPPKEEEEGV
jgi:hypothetical protein